MRMHTGEKPFYISLDSEVTEILSSKVKPELSDLVLPLDSIEQQFVSFKNDMADRKLNRDVTVYDVTVMSF